MASIYAVPYNGTTATGCDSLTENCNIYYEVVLIPTSFESKLTYGSPETLPGCSHLLPSFFS
jgi:hypothetical protein